MEWALRRRAVAMRGMAVMRETPWLCGCGVVFFSHFLRRKKNKVQCMPEVLGSVSMQIKNSKVA